jgi:transposase-like protein
MIKWRAMPNPYGVDLRQRAVAAYESGGGSYAEIADPFSVAKRTLERWVERQRLFVPSRPSRRRVAGARLSTGTSCTRSFASKPIARRTN